jgi:hypothetical protein
MPKSSSPSLIVYAEAVWLINEHISGGADFVMYWWDHAAELLATQGSKLVRFGFVTTNSITQEYSRRVVERHVIGKTPICLVFAIPNHPWTKAGSGAAAVRIAMTVADRTPSVGKLLETTLEQGLDTDEPKIAFFERVGKINANLTVGTDVTAATKLQSNAGLCHDGVKLHGKGFRITKPQADYFGLGTREGAEHVIRPYLNGRDLNRRPRGSWVIDLFGWQPDEVRTRFPEAYQYLLETVKPKRASNNRASYREQWWVFGEPRKDLRPALVGLSRFIATVDTSKHRIFQFLPTTSVCDDKIVIIASEDAAVLGILSSRLHVAWALGQRTRLGQGNDPVYVKSRCFDPFPFPFMTGEKIQQIAVLAEQIDKHRKDVQATHPSVLLTDMYNVLGKLKSGAALSTAEENVKAQGLIVILKELHEELDTAVFGAYGWPATMTDEEILGRLVALNNERATEEARGHIRWLRPEYQVARFGTPEDKAAQVEADLVKKITPAGKPSYPQDAVEQTAAVMAALAQAHSALSPTELAQSFKHGRKVEAKIAANLASLARTGFISPDGGRYSLHLR